MARSAAVASAVVLDRANALSKFENAEDAFERAGKMKLGNGFVYLYKVHDSFRGHEMLVASSITRQ